MKKNYTIYFFAIWLLFDGFDAPIFKGKFRQILQKISCQPVKAQKKPPSLGGKAFTKSLQKNFLKKAKFSVK
ncbi:MAG: hypothetical protein IJE50_02860 [Clostridia bacterium]|nr:hypothetical protein [Clostridia bacterium]